MHNNSQIFQNGFLNNNSTYLHSLRSSRYLNKPLMKAYSNEYKTEQSILPQTQKKDFVGTPKNQQDIAFPQSKEVNTTGYKNVFKEPCFNQNIFMHFYNGKDGGNKENYHFTSNFLFPISGENPRDLSSTTLNFNKTRDINQSLLTSCKINLQQRFSTDQGENFFGQFKAEDYHTRLISNSSGSSSPSRYSKGEPSVLHSFDSEDSNTHRNVNVYESQNSLIEKMGPLFRIPKEKRNDETYKLLAIRKIRKPNFKDNKSTSKFETSHQANLFQNFEPSGVSESLYDYNIVNGKRKKIVHSVKKFYASEIEFQDSVTKEKKYFNIYKDNEIGINSEWQRYLHESKEDEDIASDEEMIKNSGNFCRSEMLKALQSVQSGDWVKQISNIKLLYERM